MRWYEREGLLPLVERGPGGRRRYSPAAIRFIRLVQALRRTGMSVDDVRAFVRMGSGLEWRWSGLRGRDRHDANGASNASDERRELGMRPHAMGAEVVQFTTSPDKATEARRLGADDVVFSQDEQRMATQTGRFDLILDTVGAPHALEPYLRNCGSARSA
ncbi:zinc-binding dehydrogenase [Streptomyces sp. DASNCL29]|uniref:zinc-binding dehydrogenase n=1 Tax=Streptomyces sp. DASNCL29 TaxID=2583819 RepID=UPI001F10287A|nr:zinc-binding dehydrogenase [Streptomyces sp. DASNCL29]